MASAGFPWVLLIATCVISLIAGSVAARWTRDSRYSRLQKRLNDCERTMADLESSFQSLLESHKRLRSRTGMQELREREAPRRQETKLEARRRIFGNANGPAFAKRQAEISAGS
jgi:uncharacterized protein (DUF342 family)